jgi:bacitracin synthase 3
LKGNLDISRLHAAINILIERHETLRTSFVMLNGDPYQKVHSGLTYILSVVPVENKTLDQLAESFVRLFRLSEAPLFRIELAKLEEDEFFVMFDIHHIISDGWSLRLLISEMMDIYMGKTLKPLSIQYKEFAKWQKSLLESEVFAGKKSFWLKYFQGELPMLNLPLDYKRPGL